MISLAFLIVGLVLGYIAKDIKAVTHEIKARIDTKPEVGITGGLYHQPNENNVNQGGDTGFVSPKTPQLLEWEEQERLREEQLHVRVK